MFLVKDIFLDNGILVSEKRNQHCEYFDDFLGFGEGGGFFL